jgi:uncharacterized protein (DUF2345 family)
MKKISCFFLLTAMVITGASAQNVGIGTEAPTDKLHVNGAAASNPLLIQINSVNKLRVNSNGGTTIGSAVVAPANGLYVSGVTNPAGGIRSSSNPISIQSNNDSVEIMAGNNKIVIAANGGIRIVTANGSNGITIDAGAGDLNLKGNNVNITAANKCIMKANKLFTVSTDSTYFSTINGSIALYAAKNTDVTSALNLSFNTGISSTITTGAAMSVTAGANLDILAGGSTTLTSSGNLGISANNNMTVAAGSNYTLSSGSAMAVTAGTGYDLSAQGNLNMQSFSTARLKGSLVILNNGTLPAARVNDPTQTLYTNGVGIITAGSSTVLIGN